LKDQHLNILGLKKGASDADIKKAFRKKALQFHPDKNQNKNAEVQFVKICEAYNYLIEHKEDPSSEINHTEFAQQFRSQIKKRYNKELSEEEFELHLKKARKKAKIKQFKEENITKISFREIQSTFIKKLHLLACGIGISVITLLVLDYWILEKEEREGYVMAVTDSGFFVKYEIYDLDASKEKKLAEPFLKNHDVFVSFYSQKNFGDPILLNYLMKVKIVETKLLGDLLGAKSFQESEVMTYNFYRFHLLFWGYLIIFALPLFIYLFKGPNSFFIVFIYLTTYLSLITLFFFIVGLIYHLYGK